MIEHILHQSNTYWAHTAKHGEKKPETIEAHTDLTLFYYEMFLEDGMKEALLMLLRGATFQKRQHTGKITGDLLSFSLELIRTAIAYHDIGKINPLFQQEKMRNPRFTTIDLALSKELDSRHSLYSCVIFCFTTLRKVENLLKDRTDRVIGYRLIHDVSYLIRKHHGSFYCLSKDHFDEVITACNTIQQHQMFYGDLREKEDFASFDITQYQQKIENARKWDTSGTLDYFLLLKVVFGLLVTADFYATYTYRSLREGEVIHPETLSRKQVQELSSQYERSPLFTAILQGCGQKIGNYSSMNDLRTSLFWEVQQSYTNEKKTPLYFLEAPTGAGKTNVSYSLGLRMLLDEGKKRLFYIFPFNTLMDQTKASLQEHLPKEVRLQIINSTVSAFSIHSQEEETEEVYEAGLFHQQMLHDPLLLTSHVHFFDMLFGTSRESHLRMPHLMDAVIILDEIQSYAPKVWKHFMAFLHRYALVFRWKVVIMSATLPPLELLLDTKEGAYTRLLPNATDYYHHPRMYNRVKMNAAHVTTEALKKEEMLSIVEAIVEKHKNKRILIEMITKKAAREVFQYLKETYGNDVFLLTGDDTRNYREKLLEYLKGEATSVILVATQVIEAGVDIDMEIGIKNISLLDAEEQFAGRINRSSKIEGGGTVYFLHYNPPKDIYREDVRLSLTLAHHENAKREKALKILREKEYSDFYEQVLADLEREDREFLEALNQVNVAEIKKRMNLIDQETVQVFISYRDEKNGLYGSDVWREYRDVLENEHRYAVKRMKLEIVKEKMAPFLFTFHADTLQQLDTEKMEVFGSILYVADGDPYMTDVDVIGAKTLDVEAFMVGFSP